MALLLADEGSDLRTELGRARAGAPMAAPADPQMADRLARIAERIEGLAQSLDRT